MTDSFPEGCSYGMTLDINVAMANGYIAEDAFIPKKLQNAMYGVWYGRMLHPVRYYYFGVPDARLCEKFGIHMLSETEFVNTNEVDAP